MGDLVAAALLVVVLGWLLPRDGGFATLGLASIKWWLLAAVPLAVSEARHLRRATAVSLAAFSAALVAAVALGEFRSAFVDPLSVYALMIGIGLAAHRLARQGWGRHLVLAVVGGSFIAAWVLGAAVWFGALGEPRWLVVSWHNQSAAIMAGGTLWFTGIAWRSVGVARLGSVVAAGASLAGVYLTGSRGGLLVGVGALVVLTAIRLRGRWLVLTALVGVAMAVSLAVSLTFVGDGSPLASRGPGSAEVSAVARFAHWEAAAGMFLEDPLTGLGIGSYGPAAPGFNRADTHLTSSAHNEFLELLAEGGLVVAIPAFLLAVGGVVAAILEARREDGDPLLLAASGVVLVLGAHAFIDFDWLFPTLAGYFAVSLGVVARQDTPRGWGPVVPVGFGIVAAVAGIVLVQHPSLVFDESPPWFPLPAINEALGSDDPAAALATLEDAHRWNPGNNAINALIPTFEAILGERDPGELVNLMELPRTRFSTYDLVARQLAGAGHLEAAVAVTEEALAALPSYAAWSPATPARALWETRLTLAHLQGGCSAFLVELERLEADPSFELYGFEIDRQAGLVEECSQAK